MKEQRVSDAVVRRLPRYYRQLEALSAAGVERISSSELAAQMNLNPSQIRQDFNCFGGFGQQGYGYHVDMLFDEISTILGLKKKYKLVVAGAGNIAHALCQYEDFKRLGFHIEAVFDNAQERIGVEMSGLTIMDVALMGDYIRDNKIDIGVITARRSAAQELADCMVEAGVRGIWNFVPVDINAQVPIQNVHLSDSLLVLSFGLNWNTK